MKKMITMTLILLSTLASTSTFAADGNKEARKKEMFQKAKQMAVANIEKRISALQDTKSCISSASDKEALKKCREKAKDRAQSLRKESKERRKEMKQTIQAEREKRRAQRESRKSKSE